MESVDEADDGAEDDEQLRLAIEMSLRDQTAHTEEAEIARALKLIAEANADPDTRIAVPARRQPLANGINEQLRERRLRMQAQSGEGNPKKRKTPEPDLANYIPLEQDEQQQAPEKTKTIAREDLRAILTASDMPEEIKNHIMSDPRVRRELLRQMGLEEEYSTGSAAASAAFQPDIRKLYNIPRRKPNSAFTYRGGALRVTRLPGQDTAKNVISMEELIDTQQLVSVCIFAYYWDDQELLPLLPTRNDVPVYIGRDINMDPHTATAFQLHDMVKSQARVTKQQYMRVKGTLQKLYKKHYGGNFRAFHPHASGCAHTKLLLLEYPTFLRLVITSANLHPVDTLVGSNHWYIHDLPRFRSATPLKVNTDFEVLLTAHLQQLCIPEDYLKDRFTGRFDFSSVRVQLVTSKPGVSSGESTEDSGMLMLRRAVGEYDDLRKEMLRKGVILEYCAGSIGHLREKWLKEFYDAAIARSRLTLAEHDCPVPPVRVVFPTETNVKAWDKTSRDAAKGNIGAYLDWTNAEPEVRAVFHEYRGKVPKFGFHMKMLLALDASDDKALPFYVYVGSANFSKGAWGKLAKVNSGPASEAARGLRLEECVNFECGVVIPRHVLLDLLEPGSSWEDIVPYHRPAQPYDIDDQTCRPFCTDRSLDDT